MLGEHGRTSTKSLSSYCLVFYYVVFGCCAMKSFFFFYFYRRLLIYRFSVIFGRRMRVRVAWEVTSVVAGKVSCKKLVFMFFVFFYFKEAVLGVGLGIN